jgi:hypothetical protein
MVKQELEKRIIKARGKIQATPEDLSWISSSAFTQLLDAWSDLYAYYQRHDGETTSINCEVVNTYLDLSRFFNLLLRDPKYSLQHETIEEALGSLDYLMDGLIKEGYRQLNNP